jgi:predicted solute-binding protein
VSAARLGMTGEDLLNYYYKKRYRLSTAETGADV